VKNLLDNVTIRRVSRLASAMLALSAALAAPSGCARGCSGPGGDSPAAATPQPQPSAAPAAQAALGGHPALAVEQALQIQLPERQIDGLLPGWSKLPFRKAPGAKVDLELTLAVTAQGVRLLERQLTVDQAQTDERLRELLRWGTGQWQQRSGLAAQRLVLAIDRGAPPMLAAQVRQMALGLQPWRVVALARDGDHLVELHLNPPADRRPSGRPMPMAQGPTAIAR
jgi:hypothetical protein